MIRRATISLGSPPPLLLLFAPLDVEAVSAERRNNENDGDADAIDADATLVVEGVMMTKASDGDAAIIVIIKATSTASTVAAGLEVIVDCRIIIAINRFRRETRKDPPLRDSGNCNKRGACWKLRVEKRRSVFLFWWW